MNVKGLFTHRGRTDDEADVARGHLVLRPRQHLRVEVLAEPDDGRAQQAPAGAAPWQAALRDFGARNARVWFTFSLSTYWKISPVTLSQHPRPRLATTVTSLSIYKLHKLRICIHFHELFTNFTFH